MCKKHGLSENAQKFHSVSKNRHFCIENVLLVVRNKCWQLIYCKNHIFAVLRSSRGNILMTVYMHANSNKEQWKLECFTCNYFQRAAMFQILFSVTVTKEKSKKCLVWPAVLSAEESEIQ